MNDIQVVSDAPFQTRREVDFLKIAGEQSGGLLQKLRATHPEYTRNAGLWRTYGDVALDRIRTPADKRRYLIQGRSEQDRLFKQRVDMSAFIPESPSLLSDFIGAVFSKPVKREFLSEAMDPGGIVRARLEAFIDDGGDGNQTLSDSMKRAAELALVYGSVDLFLDHPLNDESLVPHITIYSPEQRIDWDVGGDGKYRWVKYLQKFSEKSSFDGKRIDVEEYRVVVAPVDGEPGRIDLFRVRGRAIETTSVEYAFQDIPIRTLYWRQVTPGVGESWVKPLVESDLKTFTLESDLRFDVFTHAHPTIKAWLHDNSDDERPVVDQLNIGGAYALHLNPGDTERSAENVEYLGLDTSELTLQADMASDNRQLTRRLAGNESEMQNDGGQESGVALAYKQAQRSKNFIRLSKNLQEIEWQLMELVLGEGREDMLDLSQFLEVRYPDKFDQRAKGELEQDLESAKSLGSPIVLKAVKKILAARLVGDGVTAEMMANILDEIENPNKEEPSDDGSE